LSKDKLLRIYSTAKFLTSSWIYSPTELLKVETRLTSARILPNPLLYVRPFSSVIYNVGLCPTAEYCQCVGTRKAGSFARLAFVCWLCVPCKCACLGVLAKAEDSREAGHKKTKATEVAFIS